MTNYTTLDWLPTRDTDINWTKSDCPTAIAFLNAKVNLGQDYPVRGTIDLMRRGLTKYWNAHNIAHPGDFELLEWFIDLNNTRTDFSRYANNMFVGFMSDECMEGLCNSLPFEGNSDQAGRGMLVTYYIEAILVTAYLAVVVMNKMKVWRLQQPASGYHHLHGSSDQALELPETLGWGGISNAVSNSLRPFLDSALLFALAMQIAAISVLSRPYLYPKAAVATSSGEIVSAFTALLSIFPAAALQFCSAQQLRRARYRMYAWIAVSLFALVIFVMYHISDYSIWTLIRTQGYSVADAFYNDSGLQLTWEMGCLRIPVVERFAAVYAALFGFLCLGWIVYLLLLIPALRRLVSKSSFPSKILAIGPASFMFISFCLMWAALGILTWFQAEVSPQSIAANKDYSWSFGQVLSVATFVPVVVEFGMLYFGGSKSGLSGLLPKSWMAERVGQKGKEVVRDEVELQPVRTDLG